jgi:hypothetical protein
MAGMEWCAVVICDGMSEKLHCRAAGLIGWMWE